SYWKEVVDLIHYLYFISPFKIFTMLKSILFFVLILTSCSSIGQECYSFSGKSAKYSGVEKNYTYIAPQIEMGQLFTRNSEHQRDILSDGTEVGASITHVYRYLETSIIIGVQGKKLGGELSFSGLIPIHGDVYLYPGIGYRNGYRPYDNFEPGE